jgi:LAO/AO transport system kinase
MSRLLSTDQYVAGIRRGDRATLARAITLVESDLPAHFERAQAVLDAILGDTGGSVRIGLSGVPGVGKSTFIDAFGMHLVGQAKRVAVLAVDPSSSVTGGSILGDKTRMARLSREPSAFIRPSPSSGTLGGVTRKTRESMLLCEAAGFEVVIVETVGVGQSETVVAEMSDVFVVLMLAGAGDELQGIKRGILEVADVLAINKADGDNTFAADRARHELASALHVMRGAGTIPPVLAISSVEARGIAELWDTVMAFWQSRKDSGALDDERRRQGLEWMHAMIRDGLGRRFLANPAVAAALPQMEREVRAGTLHATTAAARLLAMLGT